MRAGVRLGVDVGSVRVGLAASDPGGVLATPVATLVREPSRHGDIREVAQAARGREAIEVVVGLPRSLSGDEGPAAQEARAWAKLLQAELPGVPVRLVDERLTTVDAHRSLRESGVSGREQRSRVDQQAAVLILQVALDSERRSGQPAGELLGGRKPRARRARSSEGQG
ncbi:Holliday junction resolvase RuvX [Luteipulveratus sp. YIM 133132]|uniref:Putative pre-16S rRNA nuclease n=1 Tax=Luteipulveratus flavus TaxID=3031728 RepID=A0ABT6C5L3_9MICO|nr:MULTISPECIES: Holliday junction resolvase RuvX [unclassified Luteipulveratus]MDE9366067.1 Holliday junction resolvase RuvX [Luteipulveratus sp. YIM 133132]MDF8264172.1 Holliday junction resolvase RuvX [Luteipulveratus sp. YIM 133296]